MHAASALLILVYCSSVARLSVFLFRLYRYGTWYLVPTTSTRVLVQYGMVENYGYVVTELHTTWGGYDTVPV